MNDTAADQLRKALTTIASLWAAMYPTGPRTPRVGTIGRTQTNPMPIPAPVMPNTAGDTVDVALLLAQWALVIADDKDLHPTVRCKRPVWFASGGERRILVCGCNIAPRSTNLDHRLPATDTVAVARFIHTHADHLAGIDEAVDEITTAARVVERIAQPAAHDSLLLGHCPVSIAVDGSPEPCGGNVRAYADRPFAVCKRCGTEDTIDWWESQLLGDKNANALADAEALAAHLSRIHRRIVPSSTIRSWATKGMLTRRGKDTKGRTLFDRAEVEQVAAERLDMRRGA